MSDKVHPLFSSVGQSQIQDAKARQAAAKQAELEFIGAVSANLTGFLQSKSGDVVRQFLVQRALGRSYDPSLEPVTERAIAFAEGQRQAFLWILQLGNVAYMKEV